MSAKSSHYDTYGPSTIEITKVGLTEAEPLKK